MKFVFDSIDEVSENSNKFEAGDRAYFPSLNGVQMYFEFAELDNGDIKASIFRADNDKLICSGVGSTNYLAIEVAWFRLDS